MLGAIFRFGQEYIEVRIIDTHVVFRTGQFGNAFVPIEGIKLSKSGVIKEFPDLKDKEDWKVEAIKRFKNKIKELKNEEERMEYIINDLQKYGYEIYATQKQGFRIKKYNA